MININVRVQVSIKIQRKGPKLIQPTLRLRPLASLRLYFKLVNTYT